MFTLVLKFQPYNYLAIDQFLMILHVVEINVFHMFVEETLYLKYQINDILKDLLN